jgi:hypothetical protein
MKKILVLFLAFITLLSLPAQAAFEWPDLGPRPHGMGGAFTAVADDAYAYLFNPAGLAGIGAMNLSASYSNYYGLADLSLWHLSYSQPLEGTSLAVGGALTRFGGGYYREWQLTLSSAFSHGGVRGGANLNLLRLEIDPLPSTPEPEWGSAEGASVDVGFMADLAPAIRWGVSATNIGSNQLSYADGDGRRVNLDEGMAKSLSAGLSFRPLDNLLLAADLRKDFNILSTRTDVGLGVEYRPVDFLSLRAGGRTDPGRYSAGFGVYYAWAGFNYAFLWHPTLGGSHLASLDFTFLPQGDQPVKAGN